MARTSGKDMQKIAAPEGVPAFLTNIEEDQSLEAMREYRILPRVKVVQGMSSGDLKKDFDEGDVIFSPGAALVAKVDKREQRSEAFMFVPIMFFPEWLKISDLKDKTSNAVMQRTFDPTSQLAINSRNAERRFELYGAKGEFKARFIETLNFPGFIYGPDGHTLRGELCTIQFQKGEYGQGKNFVNACCMRKVGNGSTKIPLWAQVWCFNSAFRDKGPDKKWYGMDFRVPEDESQRIIAESDAEFFRATHKELTEAHASNRLRVDHSERDAEQEGEEHKAEKQF